MSNLVICRACLSYNVRMYPIGKTRYREIYEKQTGGELLAGDGRPDTVCYLCNSQLLKICRFFQMAQSSEKYLSELHHNEIQLTPNTVVPSDRVHNLLLTSVQRSSITDRVEDLPLLEVAALDQGKDDDVQDVAVKIESLDEEIQIIYEDMDDTTQSGNDDIATPVHEMLEEEEELSEDILIEIEPPSVDQTNKLDRESPFIDIMKIESGDEVQIEYEPLNQEEEQKIKQNNITQYVLPKVSVTLERIPIITRSQLKKGKKTNTDLFYHCEKCSYKCFYKDVLKKHLKMHDQRLPHTCKICSYRFRTYNGLANHGHSAHKKHQKCCICAKLFKKPLYLQRHMRLHSGTQPYLCDFCDRKFNHRSTYLVHLRTHTGEKPFACKWCSKTFNDKSNCRKHMKTHTGELFACYLCDKTYSLKSHLKQHVVDHIL